MYKRQDAVSVEALRESVRTSVPKGTEELNLAAFERGYEYGKGIGCVEGRIGRGG